MGVRGRRKSQYFSNIKVRVGWRWGCCCYGLMMVGGVGVVVVVVVCRNGVVVGVVVVERSVRRGYCDGGGRFGD